MQNSCRNMHIDIRCGVLRRGWASRATGFAERAPLAAGTAFFTRGGSHRIRSHAVPRGVCPLRGRTEM